MTNTVNIKKTAMELAKEELNKELQEKAVGKIKSKLRELYDARVIVANLEREIEELQKQADAGVL